MWPNSEKRWLMLHSVSVIVISCAVTDLGNFVFVFINMSVTVGKNQCVSCEIAFMFEKDSTGILRNCSPPYRTSKWVVFRELVWHMNCEKWSLVGLDMSSVTKELQVLQLWDKSSLIMHLQKCTHESRKFFGVSMNSVLTYTQKCTLFISIITYQIMIKTQTKNPLWESCKK